MPDKVNGDEIEIRAGDKYVPLAERLDAIDHEIQWVKRIAYGIALILFIHSLMPNLDLLQLILSAIGV